MSRHVVRDRELIGLGFRFLPSSSCGCNDMYYSGDVIIQKSKCKENGRKRHVRCPWVSYVGGIEYELEYGIDVIRNGKDS